MNHLSRTPALYTQAALANQQMGATQPISSLIAVITGGLLAIVLIPENNWEAPGALIASGTAMIAGLFFSLVLAAFRNPIALFRAELILMAGLVYWLVFDAVQPRYGLDVAREGVVLVFTGVTIFSAMFWIGSALASTLGQRQAFTQPATSDIGPSFVFWGALVCALMGLSYKTLSCHFQVGCLYEGLMMPRFSGWIIDPSFSPLKRLRPAGYLALPLTIIYFMLKRQITWKGVLIAILTFMNVLLLLMDGRRAMGITLGAGILVYVLLQRRITMRHLLTLLALVTCVLLLLEAMLAWRNYGIGQSLVAGRPIETGAGIIAVDKNLYHSSRAMALVPAVHPHTGWIGLGYYLGRIIPQSIWRQPAKFGFDYIGITGRRGSPGWTATFSVIGNLWIVGGTVAIILGGLFYGIAANLVSRLLLRPVSIRSRLLYTALVMAMFVSLRALNELTITGMAAFALWGLFIFRDYMIKLAGSGHGYAHE